MAHPGRLCVFVDSPVPSSEGGVSKDGKGDGIYKYPKPHAATHQKMKNLVKAFGHAAEYLAKAGRDGVELHAAHGFLLAHLPDPKINKRTDEYGASIENRMRFYTTDRARDPPAHAAGLHLGHEG